MASESRSIPWSDADDKTLLLQILADSDVKVNYEAVGAKLNPKRSGSAVKQHLQQLKRNAKKDAIVIPSADNATGDGDADVTATPKKRRRVSKKQGSTETANEEATEVDNVTSTYRKVGKPMKDDNPTSFLYGAL
ncbi:MAG: hypothetical protein Q9166_004878 [cf. Caloplaca sp. 2 TL-2023]